MSIACHMLFDYATLIDLLPPNTTYLSPSIHACGPLEHFLILFCYRGSRVPIKVRNHSVVASAREWGLHPRAISTTTIQITCVRGF